jgi:hypothetical protein
MTDLSLRDQIAYKIKENATAKAIWDDWRNASPGSISSMSDETADAIFELLKGAVKPLEWHTREDGSMSCRGAYEITHSEGRYFPWTLTCASYPHPMYLSSGDSSEALVKVAEDHNRSRILAALGVK